MRVTSASYRTYDAPRRDSLAGAFRMSDNSDRLRAAAERAYGAASASRIARIADVNLRRAQYWLRGDEEVPPAVLEQVEAIARIRTALAPERELTELMERWRAAGLDGEAISAVLADAHEAVAGRKIA